MKPYVVMVQADQDDQFFADSAIDEFKPDFEVKYFPHISEINKYMEAYGAPRIVMINDSSIVPAREQLREIRSEKKLAHIPVIILGEMATKEYIRKYYLEGANSYVIKPSNMQATRKKIEVFFRYWFEVAE